MVTGNCGKQQMTSSALTESDRARRTPGSIFPKPRDLSSDFHSGGKHAGARSPTKPGWYATWYTRIARKPLGVLQARHAQMDARAPKAPQKTGRAGRGGGS